MHVAIIVSNMYSALAVSRPACAVYFVGHFRRLTDALTPDSSLAAHQLSCLGNPHGTAPLSCPLTVLESWLERNAGVEPEQGGFLLHYLDKLVYPNISPIMLTVTAVIVCALNLAFYGWQIRTARLR